MTPSTPPPATRPATGHRPATGAARVWDALCRHIDGMAIGTTMAALHERGALALLAAQDRTEFAALRARLAASPGFLHVALRLLADQGWVARRGEPGTDQLTIAATARGRIVMTELAGAYPAAVRSLAQAGRIGEALEDGSLAPFARLARRDWGLPAAGIPPDVRRQVRSHLDGHLVAPVMHAVSSGQADIATSRGAAEILALPGWARPGHAAGEAPGLTPDGELALSLARQYRYPVTYLPLLRQVPELLFGEPGEPGAQQPGEPGEPRQPRAGADGEETHLDRELDLRFSGDVFAAACREPFLRLALPLFDRTPPGRQPALVVDSGCGDGTLLEVLYRAVREQTERGRHLAERPLIMAGVDPSPVARRMAAARLSQAGVPHVILDGDIADPAGLERALAAHGLDARDALHVCKSAIHDRAYEAPGPAKAQRGRDTAPAEVSHAPAGHSPAPRCRCVRATGRQRDPRQRGRPRPRPPVPPLAARNQPPRLAGHRGARGPRRDPGRASSAGRTPRCSTPRTATPASIRSSPACSPGPPGQAVSSAAATPSPARPRWATRS